MLTGITLIILYIVIGFYSVLTLGSIITWLYMVIKDYITNKDTNLAQYDLQYISKIYIYGTAAVAAMVVVAYILEHIQ